MGAKIRVRVGSERIERSWGAEERSERVDLKPKRTEQERNEYKRGLGRLYHGEREGKGREGRGRGSSLEVA